MSKMLILRGIANREHPCGQLDESSAKEYATRLNYEPVVLDVSGEAYANAPQVKAALEYIKEHDDVTALYGFSGGGYNVRHILDRMPNDKKALIERVIVLGAPNPAGQERYLGPWALTYRDDPPDGHLAGPWELLKELG